MIEEMIVSTKLAPGAKVSEKALSETIGLGRTPIREALQRLAAEGTVQILPRAGVIIAPIDIADQFRLIEVRRELERLLAGRAAREASPEQRESFSELALRFRRAASENDAELFIDTDREFNQLVMAAARNKYAQVAMSAIQAQTRRFWFLYFSRFGDLQKVSVHHAEIAEAIAARDEMHARAASDALVDYVEGYTRKTLEAMCMT
jgi:DNA-binding GntR family transcriptional regulator